ncbi:MAG: glycosyltransferase [Kofleriaceae bacterium]
MLSGALGLIFKIFGIIALANRVLGALVLRIFKRKLDIVDNNYEPTVEVVIPMFNEGAGIEETIASVLGADYPAHKLRITVVDDKSTDDSLARVTALAETTGDRLKVLRNRQNLGKRMSIIKAVRATGAEIIISVDSDVVVDRQAIRQLVRRFSSPRIGAVGGRVDVRNKHVNWLTRMQVIKYWYAYHFGKALELACRQVMCLSGCLTGYRRSVLMEVEPVLLDRSLWGMPVKYGEDRFLTRQIVFAGYQTVMTTDAVCRTTVPETLGAFQAQQLRWQRSGLIDVGAIVLNARRLHPIVAMQFITLLVLTIAYPMLLVRSLEAGTFLALMQKKLVLVTIFGLVYRWHVRNLPAHDRVSPFAFLPIALVFPVIYGLLIPLALFTLDSSSWETRRHGLPAATPPLPVPAPSTSAPVPMTSGSAAAAPAHAHAPAPAPAPVPVAVARTVRERAPSLQSLN